MGTEHAPAAIMGLFKQVDAKMPSAQLSGILGDRAHTYGYHRCRAVLPSGDYSVRDSALDRAGDAWSASALDIKLTSSGMITVSKRLLAACKANDPRLRALREFGGTIDGRRTTAYDRLRRRQSTGEWDDTHLWHVHLSIFRAYANSAAALRGIGDVILGVAAVKPAAKKPAAKKPAAKKPAAKPPAKTAAKPPAKPPAKHGVPAPKWPLPSGHHFGLVTGPTTSHGGFLVSERAPIRLIQKRLQALGYAPRDAKWADGIYEPATASAVARWQRAKYDKQTKRYGEVWPDDWKRLFG